jgi:hypothetical protein
MTWAARPSLPALHRVTATEMSTILDRVAAQGFITEQFATAGTTSAAESFHITATFTAIAAAKYQVHFDGAYQASAGAPALATFRLRWAAGATVTTAGTQFRIVATHAPVVSSNTPISMDGTFTPGAGQVTVGISIQGAATLKLDYSAGLVVARLAVYCVGE